MLRPLYSGFLLSYVFDELFEGKYEAKLYFIETQSQIDTPKMAKS